MLVNVNSPRDADISDKDTKKNPVHYGQDFSWSG